MKERIASFFRKLPIARKFTLSVVLLILVIMIVVNALIITYQKNALRERNGKQPASPHAEFRKGQHRSLDVP